MLTSRLLILRWVARTRAALELIAERRALAAAVAALVLDDEVDRTATALPDRDGQDAAGPSCFPKSTESGDLCNFIESRWRRPADL